MFKFKYFIFTIFSTTLTSYASLTEKERKLFTHYLENFSQYQVTYKAQVQTSSEINEYQKAYDKALIAIGKKPFYKRKKGFKGYNIKYGGFNVLRQFFYKEPLFKEINKDKSNHGVLTSGYNGEIHYKFIGKLKENTLFIDNESFIDTVNPVQLITSLHKNPQALFNPPSKINILDLFSRDLKVQRKNLGQGATEIEFTYKELAHQTDYSNLYQLKFLIDTNSVKPKVYKKYLLDNKGRKSLSYQINFTDFKKLGDSHFPFKSDCTSYFSLSTKKKLKGLSKKELNFTEPIKRFKATKTTWFVKSFNFMENKGLNQTVMVEGITVSDRITGQQYKIGEPTEGMLEELRK